MTLTLKNGAEGGSDTTVVTPANSGGTSGNAWDTVSGSPTFSATHPAHGSLGYAFPAALSTYVQWDTSLGSLATIYGRIYLYMTAYPSGTVCIALGKNATGNAFRISISSTGKVYLTNTSGSATVQTVGTLPLNQLNRIEFEVTPNSSSTTGTSELRTYTSADSTTTTEDITGSAQNYGSAAITKLAFGEPLGSGSSFAFWLDDLGASDTTWLGPATSGTQNQLSLTAALSFTGARSVAVGSGQAGALSFTGAATRAVSKLTAAALSFTGALPRSVSRVMTAGLGFGGAISRQTSRGFTATLSFAGATATAVVHFYRVALNAALGFTGSAGRQTGKTMPGGLSFAGAQQRGTGKGVAGSLGLAGQLQRSTSRGLSAALSFVGGFTGSRVGRAFQQAFTASLSFAGSTGRGIGRPFTAALSFTGSQNRAISKPLVSVLSFSGGIGRRIGKGLSGSLSFAGRLLATGGSARPIHVTATVLAAAWQAILQPGEWTAAIQAGQWLATLLATKWTGSASTLWGGALVIRAVDHRSVEPVQVQITAPLDISADTVNMAIALPGTETLTWVAATHVGSAVQQANSTWLLTVQVQVGPGTTLGQLAVGQYAVYAQVSANPSTPVILCGALQVV